MDYFKQLLIRIFIINVLNFPNDLYTEIHRKVYWHIPLTKWDRMRMRIAKAIHDMGI